MSLPEEPAEGEGVGNKNSDLWVLCHNWVFGWKREGGVQKLEIRVEVIYGCPLTAANNPWLLLIVSRDDQDAKVFPYKTDSNIVQLSTAFSFVTADFH